MRADHPHSPARLEVAHQGHLYQLETPVPATEVVVEERLDGTRRITHQGHPLRVHLITAPPIRILTAPPLVRPRREVTPKPTDPWQRRLFPERSSGLDRARRKADISKVG